ALRGRAGHFDERNPGARNPARRSRRPRRRAIRRGVRDGIGRPGGSARSRLLGESGMKTVGIIGGIGPESTVEYYRLIVTSYREQTRDGSYPQVIINSINMKRLVDLISGEDRAGAAEYLAGEVSKLANAGADCG